MKTYITALRFPLAVLVVLIHAYNSVWQGAAWGSWAGVPRFLSHVLPAFAVPLFFALSGYLFFQGHSRFGWADFAAKWRRRVRTLLVPYVVWNAVAFLLYAVQDMAAGRSLRYPLSLDLLWGCRQLGGPSVSVWGWPLGATTACVQEPLWFVRDLMVVVLCAPLLSAGLRRGGWAALLLLGAVYYLNLWPNWGGLSWEGVWYFSLGAYLALSGRDPLRATRRVRAVAAVLSLLTLGVMAAVSQGDGGLYSLAHALYVLSAMVVSLHLADRWVRGRTPHSHLAASSFFLYAAHTMMLWPLTTWAAHASVGSGPWCMLLLYLLCPVLAVVLCEGAFYGLRRWLPRLSEPLTGLYGRKS